MATTREDGILLPQWLKAYEPINGARGPYVGSGKPADGALFSITPDLIRSQKGQRAAGLEPDIKNLLGSPKSYTIGPSDVLSIVVWGHPELATPASGISTTSIDPSGVLSAANGFSVSPDGLIQFPFLRTIKVSGLTEIEARDAITTALAKYIKDPQVTLRIQAYRSSRIYVEGDVLRPGLQAINDVPMTLLEAISRAGGFLTTADRTGITLTRGGNTTRINLTQLSDFGINSSGVLLRDGDLVRVLSREDSKVFVLGEVLRPSALQMRNGRLSLNEALGESGGINQLSGDPRQIYVVRSNSAGMAEIYHLDAKNAVAYALSEQFELKARDVVFVDPSPLVNFNRVISLLIPSGQLANSSLDLKNK